MLNWLQVKSGTIKPAREAVHLEMTAKDLSDTQSELYRLDSNLWEMVRHLTIADRQELEKKIRDFCQKCQMEYMQGEAS